MRVGTAVKFIIYIGIFLIATGTILEDSLIKKAEEISGGYSMNKLVISPMKPSDSGLKSGLSYDDAKGIAKAFRNAQVTFTSEANVKTPDMKGINEIKLIGTNYLYANFDNLVFVQGRFFDKAEDSSNSKVAVIDEKLAVTLFGSTDVVGMTVKISDGRFKIVGVYSVKDSVVDQLSDSGIHSVYVPVGVQDSLGIKSSVNTVQVISNGDRLLESAAKTALISIGKSPDEFLIKDYGTKRVLMKQKVSIIIFIFGIVCIASIIIYLAKRLLYRSNLLKNVLQSYYSADILRNNTLHILMGMLKAVLAVVLIFAIWRIVRFEIYIPKDNIPDRIIDFSFYFDLIKKGAQDSVASLGSIPLIFEIKLNNINRILNWVFYLQLFAGIPLIIIGLYMQKCQNTSFINAFTHYSIVFGISVIASLSFMFAGIPPNFNPYNLMIVYLFLTVLLFKFLKGKVIKYEKNTSINSGSLNDF